MCKHPLFKTITLYSVPPFTVGETPLYGLPTKKNRQFPIIMEKSYTFFLFHTFTIHFLTLKLACRNPILGIQEEKPACPPSFRIREKSIKKR